MKETSVNWLKYIHQEFGFIPEYIWAQALSIEKRQIINAYEQSKNSEIEKTGSEYYNELFLD